MKKLLLFLFVTIFLVLTLSTVSAAEFDNFLDYNQNDKGVEDMKVDFINWFGLGRTLGTAELKSHSNVNQIIKVPVGQNTPVMWYDFNFTEEYTNGLGEVIFTDKDKN